ncbi:hypothetical protein DM02DRAFT_706685 [Periconia macrospinosa]|uniref:Uncharacterized protein n=1 Tax=Periconia macrospinosa TaxID=97972 RepID=A0A2V1DRX8_9PLEO|nr:hypothetical protein DM02DRAFT_706685 [Periconia macrospinosa]
MKTVIFTIALGLAMTSQALPAPGTGVTSRGLAHVIENIQAPNAHALAKNGLVDVLGGENGAEDAAAAEKKKAVAAEEEKAAGDENAAAEGEAANEVELQGEFDVAVELEGGGIKQDVLFTKSTVGSFEFEFQSAEADTLTVTEKEPGGVAPAGFDFVEQNAFDVALAISEGQGLMLSKIDFVFDAASPELEGVDVTQAQVGKLCAETGAFVIAESLGELEFEAEENEVTLNLNANVTAQGEWAFFVPAADAAAQEEVAVIEDPKAAKDAKAAEEKAAKHEKAAEAKAAKDAKAAEEAVVAHPPAEEAVVAHPPAEEAVVAHPPAEEAVVAHPPPEEVAEEGHVVVEEQAAAPHEQPVVKASKHGRRSVRAF